jgi:hypothetical protein
MDAPAFWKHSCARVTADLDDVPAAAQVADEHPQRVRARIGERAHFDYELLDAHRVSADEHGAAERTAGQVRGRIDSERREHVHPIERDVQAVGIHERQGHGDAGRLALRDDRAEAAARGLDDIEERKVRAVGRTWRTPSFTRAASE